MTFDEWWTQKGYAVFDTVGPPEAAFRQYASEAWEAAVNGVLLAVANLPDDTPFADVLQLLSVLGDK